ncbi:2,4'-dihydroxyacetophenone dioxygenase [Pseudonocardia sp. Ae150A_Ps1]|nr:2,4'-dihydroxyacetophenone dioxygenase [Pseudonocardia sp. Ae150A_Ps1]
MVDDMITPGALDLDCDERLWVPQGEHSPGVEFRPLMFQPGEGKFVNLLRGRRQGVVSRHRHVGAVQAFTLRGRWHYLEYDWWSEEGSFAFDPPRRRAHPRGAVRLPGDDHPLHHDGCLHLRGRGLRDARHRGRLQQDRQDPRALPRRRSRRRARGRPDPLTRGARAPSPATSPVRVTRTPDGIHSRVH